MVIFRGGWEPLNVTETTGGDVVCNNCLLWRFCFLQTAYTPCQEIL